MSTGAILSGLHCCEIELRLLTCERVWGFAWGEVPAAWRLIDVVVRLEKVLLFTEIATLVEQGRRRSVGPTP